jgi:hypothetical protein
MKTPAQIGLFVVATLVLTLGGILVRRSSPRAVAARPM